MPKHDCSVHRFLLYKSNVLWKLLPYHYLPLKLLLNNADPLSYEERSMVISSQYLMTWIVKEKFNHICLNEIYLVILYTLAATNQFAIDIVAATLHLDDTPKELRPVKCFGDGNCLFRAVSTILFGSEDYHTELRMRSILELANKEKKDLDDNYLQFLTGAHAVVKNLLPSCVHFISRNPSSCYRNEALRTI